jgi:hypothetical protein
VQDIRENGQNKRRYIMANLTQITGAGVAVETRNVFSKRAGGVVEKTFLKDEVILQTGDPTLDSCQYHAATVNEDGQAVDQRFVTYAFLNDSGVAVRCTIWGPAAEFANQELKLGRKTAKLRAWNVRVSELTSNVTGEKFVSLDLDHRNFKAIEEPKAFTAKNPFAVEGAPF